MQLKLLIDTILPLTVDGPTERDLTGIAYDSRRVNPGNLFVALHGQHADGHEFINSAIDRGAVAVMCENNGWLRQGATKIKVKDARAALALAASAFYNHPSAKLKMIGVTGTNGKTTVAFMVKHILEIAQIKSGLLGTIQYQIGDRVIPAQRTTPEALDTQSMLAQMLRSGCHACVMEVSSHAIDQQRIAGVEFDAAIFTNLTQDHLDFHHTMERYFEAKRRLFATLELGHKEATAIVNIDDPYGRRLAAENFGARQLTYGMTGQARVQASEIQLSPEGTKFKFLVGKESFHCHLPLIGRHNVYNALAAAGAALSLDIPLEQIRVGLETMPPVPGRLQSVWPSSNHAVFIDYAHTDDALRNVLMTLKELTKGRLLLVFGCGGNRDTGKRAKMGAVAASLADHTIITTDNPRKENPATICAQIEQGFKSVRSEGSQIELDRARAIYQIVEMMRPDDTVLIAGKGHETYQEFEDTIIPFDDRVYAMEALENLALRMP